MTPQADNRTLPQQTASAEDARFVYGEWDRRARVLDVPGLLELYTDDAVFESPLAPRILDQASGVLRGKDQLERFLTEGGRRRPNDKVRWHRSGPLPMGRAHPVLGVPTRRSRRGTGRHLRGYGAARAPHRRPSRLLGLVRDRNAHRQRHEQAPPPVSAEPPLQCRAWTTSRLQRVG